MLELDTCTVLELGCGLRPTPGAIHHDRIAHSPHVDIAHDLNVLPWPWPVEAFEEVIAFDVLGHLTLEVAEWLDEAWRILRPGGRLRLRLPAFDNPLSFRDPLIRRVFHDETFYYWQPGHPLHETYGRFYFAESGRWWDVTHIMRAHLVLRYGVGDLAVELRKRGAVPRPDPSAGVPAPDGAPWSPGSNKGGSVSAVSQTSTVAKIQWVTVGDVRRQPAPNVPASVRVTELVFPEPSVFHVI